VMGRSVSEQFGASSIERQCGRIRDTRVDPPCCWRALYEALDEDTGVDYKL
jgi:hypothetical protein